MDKLLKCEANYVPLTPITFLKKAAAFYANRASVIYEATRFTWLLTYQRCCRVAFSLRFLSIKKNDVVSVLAPNVPAMYEMHFAVPMAGAVLNAINTRLDANTIATILRHSEAKVFFVDYQFVPLAKEALRLLKANLPLVILIDDINSPTGVKFGEMEYEQLVLNGASDYSGEEIQDEWDTIALNYTSGTTSEPKGVVYSHRGAYLNAISQINGWDMGTKPVYLWSLPMFHCNGWGFTWAIAVRGGTNICIRTATAYEMYKNINLHKVTHMCCAPIIFNILLEAKPHERKRISPVSVLLGGASPPASLLKKIKELGFHVTHSYGLTEASGGALVCEWQDEWYQLPCEEQAKMKARQGIGVLALADVDVKDPKTMISVPRDGKTMGEIVLRGSTIMKGYLKDEKATLKAFNNGWFATGDIGVVHPNGYFEIKDRSKDIIISGGENISSVELESVLYKHPRILEAAVVAMPHPFWGESPCAFVALRKNGKGETDDVTEDDIIAYCRRNVPRFMVPKKVEFVPELPKTATGKVQKFQLRSLAKTFEIPKANDNRTGKTDQVDNESPEHDTSRAQALAISRL